MPDASPTSASGDRVHERAGGCLWRLIGGQVLVQLVGHHPTPLDLGGAAAVAWVAHDQPANRREWVARLDGVRFTRSIRCSGSNSTISPSKTAESIPACAAG